MMDPVNSFCLLSLQLSTRVKAEGSGQSELIHTQIDCNCACMQLCFLNSEYLHVSSSAFALFSQL